MELKNKTIFPDCQPTWLQSRYGIENLEKVSHFFSAVWRPTDQPQFDAKQRISFFKRKETISYLDGIFFDMYQSRADTKGMLTLKVYLGIHRITDSILAMNVGGATRIHMINPIVSLLLSISPMIELPEEAALRNQHSGLCEALIKLPIATESISASIAFREAPLINLLDYYRPTTHFELVREKKV